MQHGRTNHSNHDRRPSLTDKPLLEGALPDYHSRAGATRDDGDLRRRRNDTVSCADSQGVGGSSMRVRTSSSKMLRILTWYIDHNNSNEVKKKCLSSCRSTTSGAASTCKFVRNDKIHYDV